MSFRRNWIGIVGVVLCTSLVLAAHFAASQRGASDAHSGSQDRARIVFSQQLSKLDGEHLKVTLVEVRYGPGEASSPHSHPCGVIGYVIEGAIRTQVNSEPETIYSAGQGFYEAPNSVHLVSANASSTRPAKLVAYLICDHDAPLSVDVSESAHSKGPSR